MPRRHRLTFYDRELAKFRDRFPLGGEEPDSMGKYSRRNVPGIRTECECVGAHLPQPQNQCVQCAPKRIYNDITIVI